MASLVELSVATVALHTPVQELLAYIEYLPTFIRHQVFRKLSKFRLREMEMASEAAAKLQGKKPRDGFDPLAGDKFLFDRELQREWETRLRPCDFSWLLVRNSRNTKERARNCRHVFWELEFLNMLDRPNQKHLEHVDEMMENQKLFVDVVRRLKLSGQFICKDNAKILLALCYLRSLEVMYLNQQNFCWETMRRLVKEYPRLTELKFRCGTLSDSGAASLYTTLAKPTSPVEKPLDTCRITVLEFVRVELKSKGYRMLVALVGAMPQLLQLKVVDSYKAFDKKLLINAALRHPALERFFLESDLLGDDAFVGLAEIGKPLALRYLRLDHNDVSFKTVEAICRASMDGVLNLERLELSHNKEIRVPAIHALTPMLASPVVGSTTVLTHLDLSSCSFGLEGATCLFQALGHNKTLRHLNVARNFFNDGFGDVLADFLLANSSVTYLEANYVFLTKAGVSARLLTALETNLTLTSLSLAGNWLFSGGVTTILGALVKRAQVKPFALVDLSGNGIKLDGLKMIADIFESFINGNGVTPADSIRSVDSTNGRNEVNITSRKRHRVDSSDKDQRSSFLQCDHIVPIEELRLEDNTFNSSGSGNQGECTTLIKSIQRCVGHLEMKIHYKSNVTKEQGRKQSG